MKRITLISLGQTGAGPVYSFEMAKALALSGSCELQIIISEGVSNLKAWKDAFSPSCSKVDFCVVKAYNRTILSVFVQFFNFNRKYRIVKLIKRFRPDVLYVPFGLIWSSFIYSFIPSQIKIISTIHDVVSHDSHNFVEKVFSLLTIGSYRYIDGYVVLNDKDKPLVQDRYRKPVVVIPHASFCFYFSDSIGQDIIKNRIGFLGRIQPYKGLDLLIEAYELLKTPGLELLIAGSGAIDSDLLGRIKKNPSIELINRYISDDEFQPLLDKIDFMVLPYKRASQSGVIPLCFAYGKTVIATNVGALSEQVPEGTGVITEPVASSIAKAIDDLYSNPSSIFEMGHHAREYAISELSWERSANLLLAFIDNLNS